MSKRAEEAAMKAYPIWVNKDSLVKGFDWNEEYRDVFIQGYEQAEQDLALTWEDVYLIINHYCTVRGLPCPEYDEGALGQTATLFNETRK